MYLARLVLCLVCLWPPSDASAQDSALGIELTAYRVPAGSSCPDQDDFQAQVHGLLGRNPFLQRKATGLRLSIVIEKGPTYVGTMRLHGIEGPPRAFSAANCQELAAALALALAIAADPMVRVPAEPTVPPPGLVDSPRAKVVKHRTSDTFDWSAHVSPMVLGGATPGFSAGLAVGAEARVRDFALGLRLQSSSQERLELEVGSIDVRLMTLGLTPCWILVGRLGTCGSLSLGLLRAKGRAPLEDRRLVQKMHIAAGARIFAQALQVGRISARWFVDLQYTLRRTQLFVSEDPAWITPRYLASTGFVVHLNFK